MNLLIDTQAILWFQASDPRLSGQAMKLIGDKNNKCFVSIASLWEIAIKVNLNKLTLDVSLEDLYNYLKITILKY